MTSLQYLKIFWDDEICDHLAYHTNLYSTQQTGKSIETTRQEIETFFSIQMTMAIVKMSQYKMYWSKEFKYDPTVSTVKLSGDFFMQAITRTKTTQKILVINFSKLDLC